MIAQNAEAIVAARLKGQKPTAMVIVSMVGPVVTDNPLVFARAAEHYDWRWARGLDVCLYVGGDVDWQSVLLEIAVQRPEHLSLWDDSGKWGTAVYLIPRETDIGKPPKAWKFELDFLPWMDFQNEDFAAGRIYERDRNGVPYAIG
jgi:hypothetical protein